MAASVAIKSVDCVADEGALLGEGPLWDPRIGKLIWLDIKGGALFLYDPETEENRRFDAPDMVSAVGLGVDGDYVCANRNGFHRLVFEDDHLRLAGIGDPETDKPGNRFNDAKVDPKGGFWAGTMKDAEDETSGAWWRLSPGGGTTRLADDFHVTNGPAFDPERARVFLTDSAAQKIYVADTDGETLGPRETFVQFGEGDGYPDGMEIDGEGCLWVAFWDGGEIRRFSPEAEHIQSVKLSVPRPTSLAFVGDAIYVTSARIGLGSEALAAAPQSGGLFRVRLDRPLATRTERRFGTP